MSDKPEDPGVSRKMKKFEKPQQVASNREYLDMDTEEEEFGRQETPEPEEELTIEPEKPVFTEEELNNLIRYVKDLTTLPCLEQANWPSEVDETIVKYFCDPANVVLTIFHESGILRSRLDFPERTDAGLTYFIRSPWQIYTPENFSSTVIFGTVDEKIEKSILKFFENIYSPVAFHSDDWPAVMRHAVFSNLHEFLMCLTDATYEPMGLTKLYVPGESLENEKKISFTSNDAPSGSTNVIEPKKYDSVNDPAEDHVERLERIARYWIRRIREALNENSTRDESSSCKTIVDEILYWHYRHENLSCVYRQLTSKSLVAIVEKLERERSASVELYGPLLEQLGRKLNEAISNIEYLSLLKKYDDGFVVPNGIEDYSTRILLIVRFIGIESSFYNCEKKIEKLCRAFGNQIVANLQRHADLSIIFDGDPRVGKKIVLECVDCCEKIGNIYDRLVIMDRSSDSPIISLASRRKVFSNVVTFVRRCEDLVAIAESRMTFDRFDKSMTIPGPRGIKLDKRYRRIEEFFHGILCEIKNSRNEILDIASADWLERISRFKDGMKSIENLTRNWIDDVFKDIVNAEEGIEALHEIKRFARRDNLRETINDKWIKIWKIFARELESCSIATTRDSKLLHHPSLPPYSGNASIIRSNKNYLTRQYKMLIDASDWFDDCDAQNALTKKYKSVLAAMTEKEKALFAEWQRYLAKEKIQPESITNKSILAHHENKKIRAVRVNLEIFYLDNIRETAEWTILNYETENIFSKNCPKWRALMIRFNKVEKICKSYNGIYESASRREIVFFSASLEELEDRMSSGFVKVTWASENFERFFTDCTELLIKIEESFEAHRRIDRKIDHTMKQIEVTSLVSCEKNLIEMPEDSKIRLEQDRVHGAAKVLKKCEAILKLLLELKTIIDTTEPEIFDCWNDYVERNYEKLKNHFTNCMRLSLISALEFLRGDDASEIRVDSTMIREIESEIARLNASIFQNGFPIEKFEKVFGTKNEAQVFMNSIDRDPETKNLRAQIDEFFLSRVR